MKTQFTAGIWCHGDDYHYFQRSLLSHFRV